MSGTRTNDRAFLSTHFQRMSDEECRKIHWASLEIMERTGVRLYEQEAIDLLASAGAPVDGNLVRVPSELVEKAFSTVPKRIVLYDRNARPAMRLEGHGSYFGPRSDCLNIIGSVHTIVQRAEAHYA